MTFKHTCLHKVAERFSVVEYFIVYGFVEGPVAAEKGLPGPRRSVVAEVGLFDLMVDEESKDVGRQINGQNDEVDPVVVVQQVDPQTGVVHGLTLHPQQTYESDVHSVTLNQLHLISYTDSVTLNQLH